MCCSSAWPRPCGNQTVCRIRHCCKLQATPRSGRFPGGSWSLRGRRDTRGQKRTEDRASVKQHQTGRTHERMQSSSASGGNDQQQRRVTLERVGFSFALRRLMMSTNARWTVSQKIKTCFWQVAVLHRGCFHQWSVRLNCKINIWMRSPCLTSVRRCSNCWWGSCDTVKWSLSSQHAHYSSC